MKRLVLVGFSTLLVLFAVSPALSAEDPLEKAVQGALGTIVQGCEKSCREPELRLEIPSPDDATVPACLTALPGESVSGTDGASPECPSFGGRTI